MTIVLGYLVIRNGHKYWIPVHEFQRSLELKQIRSSDLIQSESGQYFRADQFQEFRPFLSGGDLSYAFNSLLKIVAVGATSYLILKAFENPKTHRRKRNREEFNLGRKNMYGIAMDHIVPTAVDT